MAGLSAKCSNFKIVAVGELLGNGGKLGKS
jgi:hypothetical protein